jgi:hypothetical protein
MARQAERNFTNEGRHIGSKTNLEIVCLCTTHAVPTIQMLVKDA